MSKSVRFFFLVEIWRRNKRPGYGNEGNRSGDKRDEIRRRYRIKYSFGRCKRTAANRHVRSPVAYERTLTRLDDDGRGLEQCLRDVVANVETRTIF